VLTASIRTQIERVDALLVLASRAAAESEWVGEEVEFAKQRGKRVIPIYIELVAGHPRFRDHKGRHGTRPQEFADVVADLIRDLYLLVDREAPAADTAAIERNLRALAVEEPNLAPLILHCLDSGGLHLQNVETVVNAPFHALDYAINALSELRPDESIAFAAAHMFRRAGAGTRAICSWIEATGDGASPLNHALCETVDARLIPTAIRLLKACEPRNDLALKIFIRSNAAQLNDAQRGEVILLATWPTRTDPGILTCDMASLALELFPKSDELQNMWSLWVHEGAFDDEPRARDLARYLTEAHKNGLSGWEGVNQSLRIHLVGCLRSRDKRKALAAMNHIKAAADACAPNLRALLSEARNGASGWGVWRQNEPDTAVEMDLLLEQVLKEARGDRDWFRAEENAKRIFRLMIANRNPVEREEEDE
jgi:MTH538 TIR-like domain (DUF1863)